MAVVLAAASAAKYQSRWRFWLNNVSYHCLLWIIVAAALYLRACDIGNYPGLLGDEAWYGVQAQRILEGTGGWTRTPTGNTSGLIQTGSLVLLHALFPPSTLLLRLPTLLSSLAAVTVAYVIGKRFFSPTAGMAAMMLMACLPANIAYSRLGWDPSHAPVLVLVATLATLAGRRLLATLLFALALSNHPAAALVAPFLTLAFLGFNLESDGRAAVRSAAAFASMLGLAILSSLFWSPMAGHYLHASRSLGRLFEPSKWLEFATGFVRLLSGETIYIFITGRGFEAWQAVFDAAIAIGLIAILAGGLVYIICRRDWRVAGMLFGTLASMALLFLVAGTGVVRPGFERFSVPMIPLAALTIAVIFDRLLSETRHKLALHGVFAAMCVALLAGFWSHYLRPLERGENRPNPDFWIGLPELNPVAVERILADADGSSGLVIAEDWWSYWPATYQLHGTHLKTIGGTWKYGPMLRTPPPNRTYWISYRGGRLDRQLADRVYMQLLYSIQSKDGKSALNIWRQDQLR